MQFRLAIRAPPCVMGSCSAGSRSSPRSPSSSPATAAADGRAPAHRDRQRLGTPAYPTAAPRTPAWWCPRRCASMVRTASATWIAPTAPGATSCWLRRHVRRSSAAPPGPPAAKMECAPLGTVASVAPASRARNVATGASRRAPTASTAADAIRRWIKTKTVLAARRPAETRPTKSAVSDVST